MKLLTIILLCCLFNHAAQAQDYKLSLEEAIAIGLKNRSTIANQQLNVNLAENEEAKTRTKNLPQITAGFDARVNMQLQTQVISPEATGGNPNADPIRAQFGTKYYNVLALNANQNLFNPAIRHDKQITKASTAWEQLSLEKTKTDAIISISEAYWDAAFKKIKSETSSLNYVIAYEKYLRAKTQFDNGTMLKADLDKERLDERSARQSQRNDSSQYQLALRYLINQLNLPLTASIELTALTGKEDDFTLQANAACAERVELRMERQQQKIYGMNRDKQKGTYWPSISLFANYTVQQFNNSFDPVDGKFWTPYNYVGLRFEIPVFDGLLKQKNIREFDFRIAQSQNTIEQLTKEINYEIASAQWEYENAKTNYALASENYILAQEIVKADLVRLEAGTIVPVEAKNSEYAMRSAQTNYLNALYQYILARLRVQKAMGVLYGQ